MQESDERNSRIRARAFQIWEQNGQPEGTHEEDWRQAAQQIDAEIGEDASTPHPTLAGGSENAGPAFPDPFEARRSDAPAGIESSPRPAAAGRSKARKSR